jgi:hypothetical protein
MVAALVAVAMAEFNKHMLGPNQLKLHVMIL